MSKFFFFYISRFLVPPKVLEIRGQKNGSTVEMREGQKLSLQCIAKNSKPATKLKWLRNGLDITKGKLNNSYFNASEWDGITYFIFL